MTSFFSAWLKRIRVGNAANTWGNYPAKPVRIIVPYARGGITDVAARLVRAKLEEVLRQKVEVENHPGGGGTTGAALVAKSTPDGHTLLMASSGELTIAPALDPNVQYDTLRDFVPVSLVTVAPLVIVASADAPFSNLKELITTARGSSKPVSYATPGIVGAHHVTGEWLKHVAGISLVNTTYRGGAPAVADVVRGKVSVGIVALTPALPHIRSGTVRLIAVTSAKRFALVPDWPTVAESGFPGFDTSIWVGLLAPLSTPHAVVARLNSEIDRILALTEVRDELAAHGGEAVGGSSEEFGSFIGAETAKYRKIIADAHIQFEADAPQPVRMSI